MNVQERSNWTNKEIEYLKNVIITEYDLASGGLSVIKEFKLLEQKYIDNLDQMEKEKKNITIGKLQAKLPQLAKNMVIGFGKARQLFVDQNQIPDENILSIKKDALFIINVDNINGHVSSNLNFRGKNKYSSYMRINDREFYYSSLSRSLDIKGISDDCKNYQEKYLLNDINKFIGQGERISPEMLYENLKKYQSDYLNKRLPIETYRNLDTGIFTMEGGFEMDTIDDSYIDQVDISYNYLFYVLPLIKLLIK